MNAQQRTFLDVENSANGLRWQHRLDLRQENVALAIAQQEGILDLVARVLAARGVEADQAAKFLQPSIRDLMPDPASLTGMQEAASRISKAVTGRERVAIFADYDVDGAASAALLKRFLDHFGIASEIYIPDRVFEGYGPNESAMRDLVERGAQLIVTVDCGTNSPGPVAAANEAGADVVVLDHHQIGGPIPDAVSVVNPNREDDLSGQGHLCAAGVVFLTLVQTVKQLRVADKRTELPDLLRMLDLVALATICDVVPLVGVNRAFITKGLLAARHQNNPGLTSLARVAKIGEPLNGFHLGFLIGPRINAGGRIGNAGLGARLLCTDDPVEADSIATELDRLNQERQAMERDMLIEAMAEAESEIASGQGPAVLVTGSTQWHPGVVGLLASRLKDRMRRPAFAIAFDGNGVGTGSGRSVSGFDLGRLVRQAAEQGLIVKGGGHAMAAGITVKREKLGELRAYFEEQAADAVIRLRGEECLKIDAALSADGATTELLEALEKAGPFGPGHPQPVLVLPNHHLADLRTVGHGHLRFFLRSQTGARLQAIAFRAAETPLGAFLHSRIGRDIHVAGNLSANYWNGNKSMQLRVIDAAMAG